MKRDLCGVAVSKIEHLCAMIFELTARVRWNAKHSEKESLLLRQQKTHFCLTTKVRFLNDVCLRQMMLAPPMMTASPNDVCLTAHWANIASLRNAVEQHHFERSEKHHIAAGDASLMIYNACALIYLRKCDII